MHNIHLKWATTVAVIGAYSTLWTTPHEVIRNPFNLIILGIFLHMTGIAPTPPLFPYIYRLYCSEALGYRYLRSMIHPRQDRFHSCFFPGVRSLSDPKSRCNSFEDVIEMISDAATRSSMRSGYTSLLTSDKNVNDTCQNVKNNKEENNEKLGTEEMIRRSTSMLLRLGGNEVVVIPIPILGDNYAYAVLTFPSASLLSKETENYRYCSAALVDPADPIQIITFLNQIALSSKVCIYINHVLTTHKHWDHAGGNKELYQIAAQGWYDAMVPGESEREIDADAGTMRKSVRGPLIMDDDQRQGTCEGNSMSSSVKKDASSPLFQGGLPAGCFVSKNLKFYGSVIDKPHCTTDFLKHGDVVPLLDDDIIAAINGVNHIDEKSEASPKSYPCVKALLSPGHTEGSLMFLVSPGHPTEAALERETEKQQMSEANPQACEPIYQMALFTGDCIFCGGCGAMFETKDANCTLQTYDVFHNDEELLSFPSLSHSWHGQKVIGHSIDDDNSKRKSTLPGNISSLSSDEDVLVYVGHEYTDRLFGELIEGIPPEFRNRASMTNASNTKLLSHHKAILKRNMEIQRLRREVSPVACTVPSTLRTERCTNPLLTLKREVLVEMCPLSSTKGISWLFGSTTPANDDIQKAVYGSNRRRDVTVVATADGHSSAAESSIISSIHSQMQ
eukprot:Tbor_TRINITY_DN4908_c0_g1::TRINITY_DN4908_c0_g1_i2::g.9628::m.9628